MNRNIHHQDSIPSIPPPPYPPATSSPALPPTSQLQRAINHTLRTSTESNMLSTPDPLLSSVTDRTETICWKYFKVYPFILGIVVGSWPIDFMIMIFELWIFVPELWQYYIHIRNVTIELRKKNDDILVRCLPHSGSGKKQLIILLKII